MLFMSSADFFSKSTFLKYSFKNTIRVLNSLDPDLTQPDVLLGLIWVQTVCKVYHQTTLVGEKVNRFWHYLQVGQNSPKTSYILQKYFNIFPLYSYFFVSIIPRYIFFFFLLIVTLAVKGSQPYICWTGTALKHTYT